MEPEKHKREFWKFALAFVVIIFGAIALLAFWRSYQLEQGRKRVDRLASALEEAKRKDYETAMADTYGGKTPQETLSLYIAAVEKGDYELASRYFVQARQWKELESLRKSDKSDINNVLVLLKKANGNTGSYSSDKKIYGIYKPIYVEFMLYPNGIWKIIEI